MLVRGTDRAKFLLFGLLITQILLVDCCCFGDAAQLCEFRLILILVFDDEDFGALRIYLQSVHHLLFDAFAVQLAVTRFESGRGELTNHRLIARVPPPSLINLYDWRCSLDLQLLYLRTQVDSSLISEPTGDTALLFDSRQQC